MQFVSCALVASALASSAWLGCTVDVDAAPDRLVIDSQAPEGAITAHLVGAHPAWIQVDRTSLRLEDSTGTLVASLTIDADSGIARGSFGPRTFGDDGDWRDPDPWADVIASPTGALVRATSDAAERLLEDPAAASTELAILAGLDDTLDQLAGIDPPAVPQDSCTDYWGCYNHFCTGYYYDWYWDYHSDSWQCSWYPMISCDWCPWI